MAAGRIPPSPFQVMASLQKPKRVTVLGSDGRKYDFLAKPKDDLRKVRASTGGVCSVGGGRL